MDSGSSDWVLWTWSWWKEKFSCKLWARLLWSHCPRADIAACQPKPTCLRAVGWWKQQACISKAQFPPTSTLIIHLEKSILLSAFQISLMFPYKGIPVTPHYHFFFSVNAETQFKKFQLLNSLSSAVALRPPVRTEMNNIAKHEQFAKKMAILPWCAAPQRNGRSVGLCLVSFLAPSKGSGWKSQKQIPENTWKGPEFVLGRSSPEQ